MVLGTVQILVSVLDSFLHAFDQEGESVIPRLDSSKTVLMQANPSTAFHGLVSGIDEKYHRTKWDKDH